MPSRTVSPKSSLIRPPRFLMSTGEGSQEDLCAGSAYSMPPFAKATGGEAFASTGEAVASGGGGGLGGAAGLGSSLMCRGAGHQRGLPTQGDFNFNHEGHEAHEGKDWYGNNQ